MFTTVISLSAHDARLEMLFRHAHGLLNVTGLAARGAAGCTGAAAAGTAVDGTAVGGMAAVGMAVGGADGTAAALAAPPGVAGGSAVAAARKILAHSVPSTIPNVSNARGGGMCSNFPETSPHPNGVRVNAD